MQGAIPLRFGFVCTNYNNTSFTREAISSLRRNGEECPIVVVDNHSMAEHVFGLEELSKEFPNVTAIFNDTNVGYFKGLNIGLSCLRAAHHDLDLIIVGNNDLVFPEDFPGSLARNESLFGKYAVIAPDVVTLDGAHQNPHIVRSVSRPRRLVHDLYYANYWFGIAIRSIAKRTRKFTARSDHKQHAKAQEVYQGIGACYVLTPLFFQHFKELWAPTFIMHEEFFLSKQLNDVGLRIYYEPSITVLHHVNGAMAAVASRKAWESARASYKIYRQYLKTFS